jgi:broad specificity phosphatase PhoE
MIFIRHSPTLDSGKLFGITDIEANLNTNRNIMPIKKTLSNIKVFYCSPAKRCLQTLNTIWPKKKHNSFKTKDFGNKTLEIGKVFLIQKFPT